MMRLLLLIAVTVGVLLYIPAAAQQAVLGANRAPAVEALQTALVATGAELASVRLQAWLPGTAGDAARLQQRLGMGPVVQTVGSHVTVTWRPAPGTWVAAYRQLQEVLGVQARFAVQLEGKLSAAADPVAVVEKAMDALAATGRQPWRSPVAASSAGRSELLPAHESGINVQVAVRRDRQGARVWIGWPILHQEY